MDICGNLRAPKSLRVALNRLGNAIRHFAHQIRPFDTEPLDQGIAGIQPEWLREFVLALGIKRIKNDLVFVAYSFKVRTRGSVR
jgi:hypothetical protein